jgi:(2Fe-2S) ferredoxin
MRDTHTIVVCDSHRPRIHGGGCCSDKGGERLRKQLEDNIEARGLSHRIHVRPAGCLRNCRGGISVKVIQDGTIYGRVKPDDLDEIIDRHLLEGEPVERLLVSEAPRFYSF